LTSTSPSTPLAGATTSNTPSLKKGLNDRVVEQISWWKG